LLKRVKRGEPGISVGACKKGEDWEARLKKKKGTEKKARSRKLVGLGAAWKGRREKWGGFGGKKLPGQSRERNAFVCRGGLGWTQSSELAARKIAESGVWGLCVLWGEEQKKKAGLAEGKGQKKGRSR